MSNKKYYKFLVLFILATGAGIIYQLPYIRETFYVPLQNALGLNNQQMGLLSSGYAAMATISYFLGGIIADKFSPRKLLTFSFLTSGILGLYFSTFPSFAICRIIFVLLGISTIITYWSALIKATRMLGDSSEQGRLFGLQEGIRGIMNAVLVFVMLGAFNMFADQTVGVAWAIRVCAIANILLGFAHWFLIKDTEEDKNRQGENVLQLLKGMGQVAKFPKTWLIVGVVFTAYSIYGLSAYIQTYMVDIHGLPVEYSAAIGGIRYVIQCFGGILGGFFADKIGSRIKVILGGFIAIIISFLGYIFVPAGGSVITLLISNFVFSMFIIYVIRSLYFAIIDDAGINVNLTGRTSGLVSCLGYTPDIFMFTIVGSWIDSYGARGYQMTFGYGVVMAAIGFVLALILLKVANQAKSNNDNQVVNG